MATRGAERAQPRTRGMNDPIVRGVVYQLVVVVLVGAFLAFLVHNTAVNLVPQHKTTGFDFLGATAGFDIQFSLIPYKPRRLLLAGLPRGPDEHAAGFGHRHRADNDTRLRHRGCPRVAQLDHLAAGFGLCRDAEECAAAAAALLLVLRCPAGHARRAQQFHAVRRLRPQPARAVYTGSRFQRARAVGPGSADHRRNCNGHPPGLGPPAARGHGRTLPGPADRARHPHRAPGNRLVPLRRHGCVRRSPPLRLQLRGRPDPSA